MESIRSQALQVPAMLLALIFFILIFSLNWLGYRLRKKINRLYPDKDISLGTAEGALMGLMGLLLAFSFGMAATKYDSRRQAIVDEANILTTAIMRCDVFPDSVKSSLQPDLKNYLEARISYFNAGDNSEMIQTALNDGERYTGSIWTKTVSLTNDEKNRPKAEQLVPVLIGMKTMVTTREAGRISAVPTLIVMVLLILVLVASFITGYGIKPGNRNVTLSLAFAIMISIVLYLIMELSRPRQGYINLDKVEQKIVDLRKMFPST